MKEKLLVLDDEPHILSSLTELFEDDYEVLTTTDGETALRLAREHDTAVILSDERMPGLTGHEFLQRVREFSGATRVMLSGYADMSALTEAVNNGQIFAYVSKPWDSLRLQATVTAAAAHFKVVQEMDRERTLLRALMDNIPDLIYFKDRDSRFTRVNQEQARTFGAADPADCIGRRESDFFESEHVSLAYLDEQEIVRSGRPQADRIEKLMTRRGLRWMSTTKVPMFDKSGQVSGMACISRDITNLKNIEESLREQSEHSRLIVETANDPFITMDDEGMITAWNRQAELTFGWAAAEVVGRRYGVEHFPAIAQGNTQKGTIELDALHRDGHELPVEATFWRVRSGGASTFNAFIRDITERRNAEAARKREKTLVQLLQSLTVGANESSTLEQAAQICLDRICSHTGWPIGHVCLLAPDSMNELISTALWHVDGDGFAAFREASEGCHFSAGAGLPGLILSLAKPQWIVNPATAEHPSRRGPAAAAGFRSAFGFPIVVQGKVAGVLEFFSVKEAEPEEGFVALMSHLGSQLGQVILRQKAADDLQRAKASAETASRYKSEFLTTMSHEIRTPMNAILGMADLLSESPLNSDQRDYVRIFQRAGANLLDIINDILDLSKVESGHYELESIDFDLPDLLEKTIEIMFSRAKGRGLQLTCEISPGIPRVLAGDPDRLRQILVNLIGNALKFTVQGSVILRVEQEPVTPRSLRFSVADTGIGIPADKTELIFASFTQADSSTTRSYGGTGLGLAICKGLVELMGGHIDCVSEVGKGSTFFFTAPFAAASGRALPSVGNGGKDKAASNGVAKLAIAIPAQSPAPQTNALHPGSQPATRILVAEDSPDNVFLVQAYLKGSGLDFDVAENGKVAVDKVVTGKFDMVLMDVQMPVMDGHEATRAIRRWEGPSEVRPIPIVALTAHALKDDAAKSLEAGCTAHLTKPFTKDTLLDTISTHTGWTLRRTVPAGIGALVPKYLQNVRRDMNAILAGVAGHDFQTARKLAHQLKGTGGGYGFPEISAVGAAVELAAKGSDGTEILSQLAALSDHLDRVATEAWGIPVPTMAAE